jgi:hypothetical protein
VAELVEHDEVARPDERGDHADVREVPAAEDDRVLGAFERRKPALEIRVERMVARDEPRGARADAVARSGLVACCYDVRMVREAEIVVAREGD